MDFLLLRIWQFFLPTAALCIAQCITFLNLMESRFSQKKTRLLAVLLLLGCLGSCMILMILSGGYRTTLISLLCLTIPSLIFFFWISKYKGLRFLTTYCISDISIAAMDYMAYCLVLLLTGDELFFWGFLLRDIAIILSALLINRVLRPFYHIALHDLKKGWSIMFLVVITAYMLMSLLSTYPTPIGERPEDALISVIAMLFMEISIILLIYFISVMLKAEHDKRSKNLLSCELELAQQQFETISKSLEDNRIIRHDLQHHLQTIQLLCSQQEYDKLSEYLQTADIVPIDTSQKYCSNYTVNLLLLYYEKLAHQNQVDLSCQVSLPKEILLSDSSMTVLLGNAFRNALEACQLCQKPQIRLKLLCRQDNILLQIKNTCSIPPHFENGIPVSSRGEGHGFGTSSICNLMDSIGGRCRFDYADGWFTLEAVFPLQYTNK